MAATDFNASIAQGHDRAYVEEYTPSQVAGETLVTGDLAVWDAGNGWIERAGVDPAAGTILGLMEGTSENFRVLTENGKVPCHRLSAAMLIRMSSATTYVEATHRNVEYGVTRSAAGHWQVDVSKTGANARVVVVDGDPIKNHWFVNFLAEFISDGVDS